MHAFTMVTSDLSSAHQGTIDYRNNRRWKPVDTVRHRALVSAIRRSHAENSSNIPSARGAELEGQGASPDYVPQAPPLPYDLSGPLAAWTKIVELGCFDVALRLDKSTSREQKI